jgi:hypothetical protein
MDASYRLPPGASIIDRDDSRGGFVLVSAPDLPDFRAWFADDVWWRGTFGYEAHRG